MVLAYAKCEISSGVNHTWMKKLPALVGAIEAISAIEIVTKNSNIQATRNIQMEPFADTKSVVIRKLGYQKSYSSTSIDQTERRGC